MAAIFTSNAGEAASARCPINGVDPSLFRAGMRRLAGACSIIASRSGDLRAGLTATAVCSVSAEPARLLVCVNRSVRAHQVISESGLLSVNVLSEHQEDIARRFAGMVINVVGEDRFLGAGNWREGRLGIPLLEQSIVSFGCQVIEEIPGGSHTVFLCDVIEVSCEREETPPLVYFGGKFARLEQADSENSNGGAA
ncbi:flavin reductase family protein [Paraburkholderia unamae]|jgi:flavin reductase (NADH)/flavin reductase|uniref:Flavin reductase (NADH)/flavin reductase n=1 Tax=Paraburkholderia unamae TaxID=219649 RepID=A0ABX5KH47_9BURK|nr:flavin reductase family protein [Paraburkholderia unamae]PVX76958.1 flavin reductase (NADH)/flavin reductase [Paraburkholderia unamae]CAG9260201.1 Flavin reductase [Paraburkholderia unamae]